MAYYNSIQQKIFNSPQALKQQTEKWQQAGLNVVFTNGCFDILHRGHVDYLAKAADLGDKLVVAVNTDASVSLLKGKHRPIQDEQSRLQILASLQCVSAVVLFGEQTPYELIKLVEPNVLVKGSDYKAQDIVGYDVVTKLGGKVNTIAFIDGYSTSAIEHKIKTT